MENIKRKLFDKLRTFAKDNGLTEAEERDFVLGVISTVDTDENYQAIIDFMNSDQELQEEHIIAFAVLLDDSTEKPR